MADDRLEALNELLLLLPVEDEGIVLSEFDGFCAGLIVCPETIPPSEWLAHVWGHDATPAFDSDATQPHALGLIMGHYNDVA